MKALSIRQPWAYLIVHGVKDVENRTWRTNFRGSFLVQAAMRFDEDGYRKICSSRRLQALLPKGFPHPDGFQRGGIVGEAVMVDCVETHPSPWFNGPFGFVLDEQRPLRFIPCRGMLSFFYVPKEIATAVARLRRSKKRLSVQ